MVHGKRLCLTAALVVGAGIAIAFRLRLFSGSISGENGSVSGKRLNVVLLSLDTTRHDHLGCYGYGRSTSPNIDRVAARGVRFVQSRSQAPLTLLAHMSLFTSMLPCNNTVDNLEAVLPNSIVTLPQLLQSHGYVTAAFVNDGQMQAHWGFNRGFDLWCEYREGQMEGNCDQLTDKALSWIESNPSQPFFLFLHYYDPHGPYDPPPKYREAFGSDLTGAQVVRATKARRPEDIGPRPELLQKVIGSYDGEIAWMDHEMGRLIDKLPANTLLVIFSDHGEPFREHGWLMHGATLFEEDIRTALVMCHPNLLPPSTTVDQPVMLLDVMPTILNLCTIQPPPQCEGLDVSPLWKGGRLPERFHLAENKAVYDWRVEKMAALGQWKLIYSLFDGGRQLYHLPDERTEQSGVDPVMAETLFGAIRNSMEQEDYWIVYGHGKGEFDVTLTPTYGQCVNVMQTGRFDYQHHQNVENIQYGRMLRWTFKADGATRGLYFQLVPSDAPLKIDFKLNGNRVPEKFFLGADRKPARVLPWELPWKAPIDDAISCPVIEAAFKPDAEGIYVMHHRGKAPRSHTPLAIPLDDSTVKRLRSLGYLR